MRELICPLDGLACHSTWCLRAGRCTVPEATVAQPAAEQQAPVDGDSAPMFVGVDLADGTETSVTSYKCGSCGCINVVDEVTVVRESPAQPASIEPAAPDTEAGLMLEATRTVDAIRDGRNSLAAEWQRLNAADLIRDLAAAYRASEQRRRGLEALLQGARDWAIARGHGDNCYVSRHYDGDPGDCCNCGLESLLDAIDAAINSAKGGKP